MHIYLLGSLEKEKKGYSTYDLRAYLYTAAIATIANTTMAPVTVAP
jgi:hypothetical protein